MRRVFAVPVFTALMALGANVVVPMGDVPFILSDFFVLLAGLLLGGWLGALSVALYLLLGMLGLPVFADGGAGIAHLTGPTGGYLVGYLLAAWLGGMIANRGKTNLAKDAIGTATAQAIIFACGIIGLMLKSSLSLGEAITLGFSPFLVPIAIKFSAAVLTARLVRPMMGK